MRQFGPLDVGRCLVAGLNRSPNLAATAAGLCKPQSIYTLFSDIYSRRSRSLALLTNGRVRAVAAVCPRSGIKSWEVSHLYAIPESVGALPSLLERAGAEAARGGAERVFLRVDADSDVVSEARRAGFFPCFRETLYRGENSALGERRGLFDVGSRAVERLAVHDHALFRLYNETTPLKARQLIGMTLDQWKDSREPVIGRAKESVLELDGNARGWFRTSAKSGRGRLELILHPDSVSLTDDVVDFAARSLSGAGSVSVTAPDYGAPLEGALVSRGFRRAGEFAVLVKSIARGEREAALARTSLVAE